MPNNALTGLGVSVARVPRYKQGGVAVALAFNTFTDKGLNQASYDPATSTLTVSQDAKIVRIQGEENTLGYSDNTKVGANTYCVPTVAVKLGGRNQDLNDAAVTFDLVRTTWVLKTSSEEYVVLGLANGLISSKNDSGAGAGLDDFNGFDVVLSGGEVTKALLINKTQFDALAARVTT